MKYAVGTSVPPDKTLSDIQRVLKRYGATMFAFMDNGDSVALAFEMKDRHFRINMPLPDAGEFAKLKINKTATRNRTPVEIKEARNKAVPQRWRALLLVITAKLESVESGIETLEQAFMAHMLLPSGQTVGEWLAPQMEQIHANGRMPPLLLSSGSR